MKSNCWVEGERYYYRCRYARAQSHTLAATIWLMHIIWWACEKRQILWEREHEQRSYTYILVGIQGWLCAFNAFGTISLSPSRSLSISFSLSPAVLMFRWNARITKQTENIENDKLFWLQGGKFETCENLSTGIFCNFIERMWSNRMAILSGERNQFLRFGLLVYVTFWNETNKIQQNYLAVLTLNVQVKIGACIESSVNAT